MRNNLHHPDSQLKHFGGALMIAALFLFIAVPQDVDCVTQGNTTHCTRNDSRERARAAIEALARPVPIQQGSTEDGGAAKRRGDAYAQVGKLIADGRCADAKRLAGFYGNRKLINDTAKACQP